MEENEISLETILTIREEEKFRELQYAISILERIFQQNRKDLFDRFITKLTPAFYSSDVEFRKQIILAIHNQTLDLADNVAKLLLSNSAVGNLVLLHRFLEGGKLIKSDHLTRLDNVWDMKYLHDADVLEVYPFESSILLDIQDEKIPRDQRVLSKILEALETLFKHGFVLASKESTMSFYQLYSASTSPQNGLKKDIMDAMLNENMDTLDHHIGKLGFSKLTRQSIIENYLDLYDSLRKFHLPIYFDTQNVLMKDDVMNNNFFFLLFRNLKGEKDVLFPYKTANPKDIQQIFDTYSKSFVIPHGRIGKLSIDEVYSFSKIKEVKQVSEAQLAAVRELYETDMEEKIRQIINDANNTADSPAERIDIFPPKMRVSGQDDLRNAGFILKGRGRRINLKDIGANLLKAIDLPVDIIFLVYNGTVEDEPQDQLIRRCNEKRIMYCIVDPNDLTRLLVAYGKI